MAKKSCKKGYYYCNTDEKCKKIPKGYHIMPTGYLMKDGAHKEDEKEETKKKNGNGTNGNGSGNGDSSGSSDGGGVSEGWSAKYKRSIDCDNPKGFSQRAHCQGRKKVNEAKGYEKDHEVSMAQSQLKKSEKNIAILRKKLGKKERNIPAWVQAKITDTEHNTDAAAGYMDEGKRDGKSAKDKDYSLRDWFKGGGWVQAGGKYDGKPCAKQPGQKTKPFCRDADDRASMSKDERSRRAAKKRREDPNPNRKGKAKMVTASYSNWRTELEQLDEFLGGKPGDGYIGHPNLDIKNPFAKKQTKKEVLPNSRGGGLIQRNAAGLGDARMRQDAEIRRLLGQSYEPEGEVVSEGKPYKVGDTIPASATKPQPNKTKFNVDKTGLEGPEKPLEEGKKDACYHKVKSRYSVWPSAYASGALVKCRKVGAKNWGNKKEGFSNWREDILLEGLEDKLRGMSQSQIEDLIKNNKGAEKKIRDTLARMRSATPRPQGSGPQMPTNFAKQGVSSKPRTVNVGDYANRNVPGSAWQRAQQNPSAYRPGPGVKPDFSGVNPTPRPRSTPGMRPPTRVRPRGRGRLGLALTAAGLAAPFVAGAIKKVFNREDYEYSNWRDDFQAMEFESVDIIKAEPLQSTESVIDEKAQKCWKGYEKKGTKKMFGKTYNNCVKKEEVELQEKKSKKDACKGKPKRWQDSDCDGKWYEKGEDVKEDWQKSNRKDGVDGMSQKSVNAYKRENPGSKLQTAVTEKKPKGKRAKRRKSFCARSKGQKDMHNIDCSKTPEKKICKARKRWRC